MPYFLKQLIIDTKAWISENAKVILRKISEASPVIILHDLTLFI